MNDFRKMMGLNTLLGSFAVAAGSGSGSLWKEDDSPYPEPELTPTIINKSETYFKVSYHQLGKRSWMCTIKGTFKGKGTGKGTTKESAFSKAYQDYIKHPW